MRRFRIALAAAAGVLAAGACSPSEADVTIGLITKQEENPYWVTMREVAENTAQEQGVELISVTGTSDVDVETQLEALATMTEQGVAGILIAPTNSAAVVPAITEAREAGIIVIAVDTPTEPPDAVDALLSTDNLEAGRLAGEYARAKADELGLEPRIALLNLAPDIVSGEERRDGFLEGFGIEAGAPEIVGEVDSEGDEELGRQVMNDLLESEPEINVVYSINEPAALGAVSALQDADVDLGQVVVVAVDGGCEAMTSAVRPGLIDATVQQYPQNMAREGVQAIAEAARGGEPPTGFVDMGAVLITSDPAPGVESRDVQFGVRNCWG